jgi:hypothetical protein
MTANVAPIWTAVPRADGSAALIATAASVVYDVSGTIGTDVYNIFTAGAEGSFVERVRLNYIANGTTTSVAAVLRLYISSITSGTPSAADTRFYESVALPATGALTTTAVNSFFDVSLGFALPPSYTILAKISVSQGASTGWQATVIGGDY